MNEIDLCLFKSKLAKINKSCDKMHMILFFVPDGFILALVSKSNGTGLLPDLDTNCKNESQ